MTAPLSAEGRPKVGLIINGDFNSLSSTVGILRKLEEERIEIDIIVASSQSAIVAAFYSLGYSLDDIELALLELHKSNLYDEGNLGLGVFLSRYLTLRQPSRNFDEFAIPLRVITTDIATGERFVIKNGGVTSAVQAAWYKFGDFGNFEPVSLYGRQLFGLNLLGIDVARESGADVLIAVNQSNPRPNNIDNAINRVKLLESMYESSNDKQIALLRPHDYLINPDISSGNDLNQIGYSEASKIDWSQYSSKKPITRKGVGLPRIEFLQLVNSGGIIQDKYIFDKLDLPVGKTISDEFLKKSLNRLKKSGNFTGLWAEIVLGTGGHTGLEIHTVESRKSLSLEIIENSFKENSVESELLRVKVDVLANPELQLKKLMSQVSKASALPIPQDISIKDAFEDENFVEVFMRTLDKVAPERLLQPTDRVGRLVNWLNWSGADYTESVLNGLEEFSIESAPYLGALFSLADKELDDPLPIIRLVQSVSDGLRKEQAFDFTSDLENVYQRMNASSKYPDFMLKGIQTNLAVMKEEKQRKVLSDFIREYSTYITSAAGFAMIVFMVWLIYWFAPLRLLAIRSLLYKGETSVASLFKKLGVPVDYLLVIGFFVNKIRVLDAWTNANIESYQRYFLQLVSVNQRKTYVSRPIRIKGETFSSMTREEIFALFSSRRSLVWISGEGGSGKTTLALNIAKMLMSESVIPVLIEPASIRESKATNLSELARGILSAALDLEEAIEQPFFEALLRRKKIVIIFDSFSELSREQIGIVDPSNPGYFINSMIVTSRKPSTLSIPIVDVQPVRISGENLASFLDSYLSLIGKRDIYNDSEFFRICTKLSSIVGNRDFPIVIAKMYADMISRPNTDVNEPISIPGVMLAFLNNLNRLSDQSRYPDHMIQYICKKIAWECTKTDFYPKEVSLDSIIESLSLVNNARELLRYLVDDLGILVKVGVTRNKYHFSLDPLAEYLAAMYLVERVNPAHIEKFFSRPVQASKVENSIEFINAVEAVRQATDL